MGSDALTDPGSEVRVALVDLGLGNRRSVEKALERVGAVVERTTDPARLRAAGGLVLPGVGAFPEAMRRIRALDLEGPLRELAAEGKPLIGLCLGMQLLLDGSEELGGDAGLGLIPGTVQQLDTQGLKLPHIGWNALTLRRPEHPLLAGLPDPLPLYHVHSFVAAPADPGVVLAEGHYGSTFPSILALDNVMGAQCHPEKSSRDGLGLLENFLNICGGATAR
ncbi:MAG: imidazole glycerol phosphate synthase subunit HisH [Solirubrobacteraceae bacterium]|nr:imidazole glycerol phosphate synthase subunit HisH [Solirubrobacteraceae bacterium]